MFILITSGPTRQYLDPVRYLSNGSTGRMGAALARAVLEAGAVPVVVTGPVEVDYPVGTRVHRVETTEQMRDACLTLFPECAGVIGAAAPCDFRPEKFSDEKIAKNPDHVPLILRLVETPDILRALADVKRPEQWIVAFALETHEAQKRAMEKMHKKGADLLVLNGPASIGADISEITLWDAAGKILAAHRDTKDVLAREILRHALLLRRER